MAQVAVGYVMPAYITLTLKNVGYFISHPGYEHVSQHNAIDRIAEMSTVH